jgi:hypothetical protein
MSEKEMLSKEQMRIKLEHILKVINQIDNDLVLEQSEKESLLNEAVALLKQ